jgi:topoisomerase-4 subunit A
MVNSNDIQIFSKEIGFYWTGSHGKKHLEKDLLPWQAARASMGKIPPSGFAKNNMFDTK